jgi:hypothetical protein
MSTKFLQWIGIIAAIGLIIASFMPWTYDEGLKQTFTGFYSMQGKYGKPGKFLIGYAVIYIILCLLPKVWAKWTNIFLAGLMFAYVLTRVNLYGGCYYAYCPQKLIGLYLIIITSLIMLITAVFPNLVINKKKA